MPESQTKNREKVSIIETDQQDDALEDLSYLEPTSEQSEDFFLFVGEEMLYNVDENDEFNSYTDTT